MRLVVTLLVRDEADVVAATIEHHVEAGADLVLVTDNASVDGTVEVLEDYASAGVVELLHESRQDYDQAAWVTSMARRAYSRHGADWVVNADADELWRPREGWRLREALAAVAPDVGQVRAWRTNYLGYRDVQGPWSERLVLRDTLTLSERGTPLGPKVAHRAAAGVSVAQGNHAVSGLPSDRVVEGVLDVLHVPMRSYQQFERKIRNGGQSYARNSSLPPEVGWHWRSDYDRLLAGTLTDAYRERQPDPRDASGRYVVDPTLHDRLQALVRTAVLPGRLLEVLDHR